MSMSALRWFVTLTTQDASIPEPAAKLGTALQDALDKTQCKTVAQGQSTADKNLRVQVGRLFRRKGTAESLPMIRAWLADDIGAAVTAKGCALTQAAWAESVQALDCIIKGVPASSAWGLAHVHGVKMGISRTLEARALARYLARKRSLGYSKNKAIEIAAELFGVDPRDLRRYTGVEPIGYESEAMCAYSALVRDSLLRDAERYFDPEELRTYRSRKELYAERKLLKAEADTV